MGTIADLIVRVGADVTSFKTGMGEVNKDVEEAGTKAGKFGGVMLGAGVLAAGAVTGVVAFGVAAVAHTEAAGQAAFEMSEKFGLAKEAASGWLAVGANIGLSSEEVGKGFQFLAKNVEASQLAVAKHTPDAMALMTAQEKLRIATDTYNASLKNHKLTVDQHAQALLTIQHAQDTYNKIVEQSSQTLGPAGQAFGVLGISILDSSGHLKDANTLMLESADRFKAMEDGPEKTALAMKLFGKAGADLIPMLNLGSAGLKDMTDKAKASGEVLSGDAVDAAHKLYLEHKQLDSSISGVTTQIGLYLMPIMAAIMGYVISTAIPAVQRFAAYFREHLLPAISQIWSFFMMALGPALKYIMAHFDEIKPVLIAVGIVFAVVLGAVIIVIALVVLAVVGLVAGILWLVNKSRTEFSALLDHVESFAIGTIKLFRNVVSFIEGLPGDIGRAAGGMWDGIWNAFKAMLNMIVGGWNSLHFTIGGGNFAGVDIPSVTLGVPTLPYFHMGGIVPGVGNVLAVLEGGEHVTKKGAMPPGGLGGPAVIHNHFYMEGAFIQDGPALDMLANKLVQRMQFAPGT